jgi:BirA family biotin operon repressor/biotin-[acetyl-CoA-carboxylase] ligase
MRRIHFDETDSTNVQARRLAADHPGEALLVTAAAQSAGRGRSGRSWASPLGGAWLSVVWPTRQAPAWYSAVSLAAAAAVDRAICQTAPAAAPLVSIKWPNDLLLDDYKVAGILCEQVPGDGATQPGCLIVGVGVNVDFDLALLPAELRHPASTLYAATGSPVAVDAVIDAVAHELAAGLVQFESEGLSAALVAAVESRLAYVGAIRTWETSRGAITGRILGLDSAGRLRLETADGTIACDSGEIIAGGSTRSCDA